MKTSSPSQVHFLLLPTKVSWDYKLFQSKKKKKIYIWVGYLQRFKLNIFIFFLGQTKSIRPFPLVNLLPQNNLTQYYRYHGSLTTPPCSQVVLWTVYEVPVHISWAQVRHHPKYNLCKYVNKNASRFFTLHNATLAFSVLPYGCYNAEQKTEFCWIS